MGSGTAVGCLVGSGTVVAASSTGSGIVVASFSTWQATRDRLEAKMQRRSVNCFIIFLLIWEGALFDSNLFNNEYSPIDLDFEHRRPMDCIDALISLIPSHLTHDSEISFRKSYFEYRVGH
jgi:hypothetical protein